VIVAVFGMGRDTDRRAARLVAGLEHAVERLGSAPVAQRPKFAPPPPWGPLEVSPREAFLGGQEVVPLENAVGRIAAESLAAYPPGIPNVLPDASETTRHCRRSATCASRPIRPSARGCGTCARACSPRSARWTDRIRWPAETPPHQRSAPLNPVEASQNRVDGNAFPRKSRLAFPLQRKKLVGSWLPVPGQAVRNVPRHSKTSIDSSTAGMAVRLP